MTETYSDYHPILVKFLDKNCNANCTKVELSHHRTKTNRQPYVMMTIHTIKSVGIRNQCSNSGRSFGLEHCHYRKIFTFATFRIQSSSGAVANGGT